MKFVTAVWLLMVCCLGRAEAPSREVAITIDDLPLAGAGGSCDLERLKRFTATLLEPIRADRIPITGFVNENKCRGDLRGILDMWLDAGAHLGNHTYSHPDLNNTPLAQYQADVIRGEELTRAALARRGRELRYFRHPFLHAGQDLPTKRALEAFLAGRGCQIAPVTLDNSDYMFAAVYEAARRRGDGAMAQRVHDAYLPYLESIFAFFEQRSVEVVGRECRQILLLHANELNADSMPALLRMMRSRGYSLISLEQALRDQAYRLPDDYAGPGGFSWIHRWSMTKGMRPKGEPDEPAFIREEYGRLRRDPRIRPHTTGGRASRQPLHASR